MKKEIVFVMDRSGSMSSLMDESIKGFNSMIDSYKKDRDNEYTVSLFLFDNQYETVFKRKRVEEIEELTKEECFPRGMTALIDATCFAIDEVGRDLEKEENKPERVIFVITTDGAENSSSEFSKENLKDRITHQQDKYNWEFLFLGANIDSFADAGDYGISVNTTTNFDFNSSGVTALYSAVSSYSTTNSSRSISNEYENALKEQENTG